MLMTPSVACGTGGNGHNEKTTRYGLNTKYFFQSQHPN